MNERPILFTPGNVQAILDGSKVQTRRMVKLPLIDRSFGCELSANELGAGEISALCPFGAGGARLWVKEPHYLWGRWHKNGHTKTGRQKYRFRRTSDDVRYTDSAPSRISRNKTLKLSAWVKRSPLFMAKADARLWLEIVEVRVERLQEISEEDAVAEGAFPMTGEAGDNYRRGFRFLWESINGSGSWEKNPWVWAISFKRVTA